MRRFILLAVVLLMASALWAQSTATAPALPAVAAVSPIRAEVQGDAAAAIKRFNTTVIAARLELVRGLEAAKSKATRAGDLDTAMKLRDLIDPITRSILAAFSPAGRLAVRKCGNRESSIIFRADGTIQSGDGRIIVSANWELKEDKLVIAQILSPRISAKQYIETYTLSVNPENGLSGTDSNNVPLSLKFVPSKE